MKKWIAFLIIAGSLSAEMQNHYVLGTYGMNSAVKPERGGTYANIYTFYKADHLNDQSGHKVPLKGNKQLNVQYLQNIFGYYSTAKLFGASYGLQINIPCETFSLDQAEFHRSFQGAGKKLKLGDVYFEPVNFRWNWSRLYFFIAYGAYAPTGKYETNSMKNTGLGNWGQLFTLASTWYFDQEKTFSASAYATYEIHEKKRGADFRPGDNLCIDWAMGKTFDQVLTIAVAGYYERQWKVDKGSDVPGRARGVRDKVVAIGPELDLFIPQMNGHLTARYEFEVQALSRTQGRRITALALFAF